VEQQASDAVRHVIRWTTVALNALITLGIVLVAPTMATAAAGSLPTTHSDVVDHCIDQELVRPVVEKAAIYDPGTHGQSEVVALQVAATPEECRGVVERMVQWEITKNELRRIDGKLRHEVMWMQWFGYDGYVREVAGPAGISGAANPHRGEKAYYHCSVGKARTKVRLNMRVIITNASTHKEIARKKFPGPLLEIRGINKGKGC
jgi:hypothetical protein